MPPSQLKWSLAALTPAPPAQPASRVARPLELSSEPSSGVWTFRGGFWLLARHTMMLCAACSCTCKPQGSVNPHRCVHRTDSLTSALVCAQPPTAPVSGPSTAITAVAGKSGDTQYIVVKLLPASDNGGTSKWLPVQCGCSWLSQRAIHASSHVNLDGTPCAFRRASLTPDNNLRMQLPKLATWFA